MSTCEHCKSDACEAGWGRKETIECRDRELALLRQKLAASERERQCLAKLAAWSAAAPGNRFEFVSSFEEWSLCAITGGGPIIESAEVSTPAAAAIDLATKLGLLDKAGG
jgi:hypothetical protein